MCWWHNLCKELCSSIISIHSIWKLAFCHICGCKIFPHHSTMFLWAKMFTQCQSVTYFSTQALKATLQLTVFDLMALILKPFENWLVVLDPEGMVQSLKLCLLPGSPEMTDEELAWEKVPGIEQRGKWQIGEGWEGKTGINRDRKEDPTQ